MKHSIMQQLLPWQKSCQTQNYQYPQMIYNNFATRLSSPNEHVLTCPFKGVKNIIHISNEFALSQKMLYFSKRNCQLRVWIKNIIISQAAATFTPQDWFKKNTQKSKRNALPCNFLHEKPTDIASDHRFWSLPGLPRGAVRNDPWEGQCPQGRHHSS